MEAVKTKRAAIRLALAGGGAALTAGLVVATVVIAARQVPTPAVRPAWDVIETADSYALPIEVTPVAAAAPDYVPPAYAEPRVAERPAPRVDPVVEPAPATSDWPGPLTIHNPAAFGPPEDGSLPPVPGSGPAFAPTPRLASRTPSPEYTGGPLFAPAVASPPTGFEPTESAPLAMGIAPPAPLGPSLEIDRDGTVAGAPGTVPPSTPASAAIAVATATRPLRELGDTSDLESANYTLSTNDLSKRLEPEVRAGFRLGRAGAMFAARDRFVSVLRRIAMAKDAEQGVSRHAEALAEGLRTLDDADDFVPKGDALEAELDVAAVAQSHGVRLETGTVPPHEAIARYSQLSAARLAEAAAGEPAGSMALYGLGKTYARLEDQLGDPTAGRKSLVMYRAAVDANRENYLAANELGVRLARDGRYEQAAEALRTAASQPGAIGAIHANLAAIEQRLGNQPGAAAALAQSEALAQRERLAGEVSRRHGVEWTSPDAFRAAGQPAPPTVATAPAMPVAQPGPWSGAVRTARRLTNWGGPPVPPAQRQTFAAPPTVPQQRVVR